MFYDANGQPSKKNCRVCNELKLLSEFYRDKSRSDGLCARCKTCDNRVRYRKLKTQAEHKKKGLRCKLYTEADYRDKYQRKWGGNIEVPCIAGKADLVTPTRLVEVKAGVNWKHAIGQLFVYSVYFPGKELVLILFDHIGCNKEEIERVCNYLNVEVVFAPYCYINSDGFHYAT